MRSLIWCPVVLSVLAAGCGDGGGERLGQMLGIWRGVSSSGVAVTMVVERETPVSASVMAVNGVLTIGDPRCLRSAPFAGTLTTSVLEISASGTGTVSASTFADVDGVLSGDELDGSLALSGDGQLEACDQQRHGLTLVR